MKTITYNQYLQLIGLREIVRQHWKMCDLANKAASEITGEDEMGHTNDIMFDSRELDEGLKLMEIEIAARTPEPDGQART